MADYFDLIVIGGGPAGLSAAIYGGRAKLKTLVLEKATTGGRAYTTREIVNYPGLGSTTGPDLSQAMTDHAKQFNVEIRREQVKSVDFSGDKKLVKTRRHLYEAGAVILATGTTPRVLNIPGEAALTGMGVAYCATCDAPFFQDQTVVVVGSGDQGIEEGMYLTKFANKVIVIVLHEEGVLDCNRHSAQKALANPKMEFVWNSMVEEICGEDSVTGVRLKDTKTGKTSFLECQGIFLFVGTVPVTDLFKGQVARNDQGWILTNDKMETSCSGVYAAGDVREKYLRQICTSVADGAIAATAAVRYLEELRDFQEQIISEAPILLAFWDPELADSLDAVSKGADLCRSNGWKLMELDVSRRQFLAQRYEVSLTAEHPAYFLLLEHGSVVSAINL